MDVTERREAQARSEFLSQLTQKLSLLSAPEEINRVATREVGQFLEGNRCYFFESIPPDVMCRVLPDWHASEIKSLVGTYDLAMFGEPAMWKTLQTSSVCIDDPSQHEWTKRFVDNYLAMDIGAAWIAPFCRDDKWITCLGVSFSKPRRWSQEAREFLENVMLRVWPLIERARSELKLRDRDEALSRIAAAVEFSEDAIITKSLDGTILSWNAGAERIFGYSPDEIIGKSILTLMPLELQKEEPGIIERLRSGQRIQHYETVRLTKDGRRIDISLTVSPVKDASGTVIAASKIARDITKEKKRQEALRESEERFRNLADSAPMLIWVAGLDKLCTYFNKTWHDFTGRTMEQESGMGWAEGVHPEDLDRCVKIYVEAFDAHQPFEMEYRLRHHSGEFRWILDKGIPRFGPEGTFQGFAGACVDISDIVLARQSATERRDELERVVSERTASLQEAVSQMEEFSYSVSHDLRAPLRAMQGYADVLLEDYSGKIDAKGQEYLRNIVTASNRMDRLTHDVLVYSKIPRTSFRLQAVDLDGLVQDIVRQNLPVEAKDVALTVGQPLLPVLGNESFLFQTISNLVDNAIKFASKDRSLQVRLWTEKRRNDVRLWVEDNGIGILPEHQDRVWGMFERVHPRHMYEGTGIGLAIVRKTVERMNGTMGVESDGTTGSRFWIQLPAV